MHKKGLAQLIILCRHRNGVIPIGRSAHNEKKVSAKKAKVEDIDPAHDFFDESSRDEARHARMLKGILERYF